ncbi:MAG TPA: hypothetical protein EYH26_01225 [Pyrodictium sp.]|nr:hypothetical protein [Pyrodictium sp.]
MIVSVKQVAVKGFEDKIKRYVERLLPGAEVELHDHTLVITVPRVLARTLMKRMKKLRKLEEKFGITLKVNIAG